MLRPLIHTAFGGRQAVGAKITSKFSHFTAAALLAVQIYDIGAANLCV